MLNLVSVEITQLRLIAQWIMLTDKLPIKALGAATLIQLLSNLLVTSRNIDTLEPIVREAPTGLDDRSYFGYTLVLHQTNPSPANSGEAISGVRLVIQP